MTHISISTRAHQASANQELTENYYANDVYVYGGVLGNEIVKNKVREKRSMIMIKKSAGWYDIMCWQ